ncbi:cytochrome c [Saprospiraceae bacterium]|nr:cytochrome c [Saprospiraceae bacterium]
MKFTLLTLTLFILAILAVLNSGCKPVYSQGRQLFENNCGNCHGKDGLGLRSLYPPIANSDYLENNFEKLPCIITKGVHNPLTVNGKQYTTPMAGLEDLTDIEITNIVNFISSNWYPNHEYISLKDINVIIGSCK